MITCEFPTIWFSRVIPWWRKKRRGAGEFLTIWGVVPELRVDKRKKPLKRFWIGHERFSTIWFSNYKERKTKDYRREMTHTKTIWGYLPLWKQNTYRHHSWDNLPVRN